MGSATVPVALAGVPPASLTGVAQPPFGGFGRGAEVFGQRPKTASGTPALPNASASFRLSVRARRAKDGADHVGGPDVPGLADGGGGSGL